MRYYRCVEKYRDKNNVIIEYWLRREDKKEYRDGEDSGEFDLYLKPKQLKSLIYYGDIEVLNLKLTSDGRLIDKTPEEEQNTYNRMNNKSTKYEQPLLNKYADKATTSEISKLNYLAGKAKSRRVGKRIAQALMIGLATTAVMGLGATFIEANTEDKLNQVEIEYQTDINIDTQKGNFIHINGDVNTTPGSINPNGMIINHKGG